MASDRNGKVGLIQFPHGLCKQLTLGLGRVKVDKKSWLTFETRRGWRELGLRAQYAQLYM